LLLVLLVVLLVMLLVVEFGLDGALALPMASAHMQCVSGLAGHTRGAEQ